MIMIIAIRTFKWSNIMYGSISSTELIYRKSFVGRVLRGLVNPFCQLDAAALMSINKGQHRDLLEGVD